MPYLLMLCRVPEMTQAGILSRTRFSSAFSLAQHLVILVTVLGNGALHLFWISLRAGAVISQRGAYRRPALAQLIPVRQVFLFISHGRRASSSWVRFA